jgi:hypothetical protein
VAVQIQIPGGGRKGQRKVEERRGGARTKEKEEEVGEGGRWRAKVGEER